MEDRNGFAYFLLGLGVGVAAGILLAPKSGEETRKLLRNKAEEGSDFVKARVDDSKEYVRKRADDLRGSASDLYEQGKTTVARHRDNIAAAVEAGKQAYRDAVTNFPVSGSGEGV